MSDGTEQEFQATVMAELEQGATMHDISKLAELRKPFEPHQISTLPKPYKKESPKGNCTVCGGYHGLPAAHLDYVGHAALTDRLLSVDPRWTWEPLAVGPNGLPVLDGDGGMWIRLTVCGVTRLGYGDAQGKTGGNATKERIGDALRNAAMRFGAALDLWHKGDLHGDEEQRPGDAERAETKVQTLGKNEVANIVALCQEVNAKQQDIIAAYSKWGVKTLEEIPMKQYAAIVRQLESKRK